MQELCGPCKIANLSHLLWSYGTHVQTRDEDNSVNMYICLYLSYLPIIRTGISFSTSMNLSS